MNEYEIGLVLLPSILVILVSLKTSRIFNSTLSLIDERIDNEKEQFLDFYNKEKQEIGDHLPRILGDQSKEYLKGYLGKMIQQTHKETESTGGLGDLGSIQDLDIGSLKKTILNNPNLVSMITNQLGNLTTGTPNTTTTTSSSSTPRSNSGILPLKKS